MSNFSRLKEWYLKNDPLFDVIVAIAIVAAGVFVAMVTYCISTVVSLFIIDNLIM